MDVGDSSNNGNGHADGDAADRIDALYREHGRTVAAVCTILLRDRAEAEDAAQQVFLSAYRALLNGSVPRQPAAWLAVIARNECGARMHSASLAPVAGDPVDVVGGDLSTEVIRRAEFAGVWEAIEELPRSQREVFLLREIRGLSYDQLAESLALSRPTVRSLLSRARQRLRRRLEDVPAALGGVSWIEALARLLAGGSSPVVSSATKAVALGLGAAAITGGAVAPQLVGHETGHHRVPASATAAPRAATVAATERGGSRTTRVLRPRNLVIEAARPAGGRAADRGGRLAPAQPISFIESPGVAEEGGNGASGRDGGAGVSSSSLRSSSGDGGDSLRGSDSDGRKLDGTGPADNSSGHGPGGGATGSSDFDRSGVSDDGGGSTGQTVDSSRDGNMAVSVADSGLESSSGGSRSSSGSDPVSGSGDGDSASSGSSGS